MDDFFVEDILEQFEDYTPDPRPMNQEPRNMYSQGSSVDHAVRTVDPIQDSGNKIEEVLKAYERYRGSRKGRRPMKFKNFFELYSTENFATGGSAGQLVQPNDDGSRPGYNGRPRSIIVDDEELVSEWRNSLKGKNPKPWIPFLENKFNDKTANAIRARSRNKIKNFNPAKEFDLNVKQIQNEKKINFVKQLVEEHNLSDRFLYDKEAIYKKLGVAKIDKKNAAGNEILEQINLLDKKEDKVAKAFDKIIDEDIEIYKPKGTTKSMSKQGVIRQMISDIVSQKKGSVRNKVDSRFIQKVLDSHQPYLDIKPDFDYLNKYQSNDFIGKNISEALEYSKYTRGGLDIKNLADFKSGYTKPEANIFSFATRHAYLNNKAGTLSQVQFFKLNKNGSKGAAIDFDKLPKDTNTKAKIFDTNKVGFEYKGQFFNKKNLKTEGFKSGLFEEVYNLSNKGRTLVPDPNNPSKQIKLGDLLQKAGDKLTIAHDDIKGGVTKLPFNNLKVQGGKLNIALYGAYGRVKNKQLRKLIVDDIATKFPSIGLAGEEYEKAFINEQSNIVKNLSKKTSSPSLYRGAGQNIIKTLDTDLLNKSKPFQKEIFRVAGMGKKAQKELFKNLNPKHQQIIKNQFCPGNKAGGQPGTCDISEAMDNMLKQTNAVKAGTVKGAEATRIANKASKVVKFGTGKGLGAVLGPLGLGGEAVFEIAMAVPGYGKGKSGKRLLGDSLLGLIPGVGQSSEEEFTEYATKDGMQDFEQQQIKDANRFLELSNSLGQLQNAGALEGKGAGRGNVGRAENLFFKQMDEYTPLYNQFVGAPPSESVSTVISEQDRINRKIAEAEAIRAQKRNIAGEEDFMAADGGLANLMKKYYD